MRQNRLIEFWVGIFMVLALIALVFLALRVSGLTMSSWFYPSGDYQLTAVFNDIGNLKVRAPVRVAGVQIGQVTKVALDPETFQADVVMEINPEINDLPKDTSASVATVGLLGENYISLTPGYSHEVLKPGDRIATTYSATSLSSLISTFMNTNNVTTSKTKAGVLK